MNRRRNLIPNILLAIILTICLVGITWTYLYELGYCAEPSKEAWEASQKRIEELKKKYTNVRVNSDEIVFEALEQGCKGSGNFQACVEWQ